ncbi:MAG: bis(5'-nucleosyl)-tetraphosphatase (symmetrical) YqeK [Megasphaera sp.]|jgi:predicted HD superfamily hydrolase involved in NAD metabolism|uniref:bis(5'-nucleosyl)-tetraphosphatase (symmetrical) YqeK n=1 Tax=Megasphaera sueciensis TaxID=349094 RepID=UPI003D03BA79|nr:bis(5'-nucleosyl)-tetraphosphatase (symmetrical) YqeK [Megasphaera sp.]MCI1824084.1 bis(5'-nucleosyl)-tetraphosphatase (symmetrical) YqeK [Megasphaera sp.]
MYEKCKTRIKNDLTAILSKNRYTHVLGVAAAARELAERYGSDLDKAELAGLLHDSAKELKLSEMQQLAERSFGDQLPPEITAVGSLLHGYAAVTIAKEKYNVHDADILAAIAHHTTGALHMSVLEKIVFLADYIEKSRNFNGVQRLREMAVKNLDQAVLYGFDLTISHLLEQRKQIYVGTVRFRNSLIEYMEKCNRECR